MPKYSEFKVEDHYLYFTSDCIVEAMHAHASDRQLTEAGSAKFWVLNNGDTVVAHRGNLTGKQIRGIQRYIKKNFLSMCAVWANFSGAKSIEDIEFRMKGSK